MLAATTMSPAQTLTPLVHPPPGGANLAFQLTDGTVMCQANREQDWWKLTPDITGSYVNGTWTKLPSLQPGYVPDDFASAVLADGRLVITGGEYNNGQFTLTNLGAIYDPVANTWTPLAAPPGWDFTGDSPAVVLPDGRFVVGRKLDMQMAALDPATLTWTLLGTAGKSDFNAEEGWTLLPDGTILTFDVLNAPNSGALLSRYAKPGRRQGMRSSISIRPHPSGVCLTETMASSVTSRRVKWVQRSCCPTAGSLPPGPTPAAVRGTPRSIRRPFCLPARARGRSVRISQMATTPATLSPPSCRTAAPSSWGVSGKLYEFNGTTLTATLFAPGALMTLPTGQVLVSNGSQVSVYTPANTRYSSHWTPRIKKVSTTLVRGSTYKISGLQFNGLSQAASFGDELETATNYPLVRITNAATGHVFYARTHDHSTMGVATGSTPVTTNFDVPAAAETGASALAVVANGIPSKAVNVTIN